MCTLSSEESKIKMYRILSIDMSCILIAKQRHVKQSLSSDMQRSVKDNYIPFLYSPASDYFSSDGMSVRFLNPLPISAALNS